MESMSKKQIQQINNKCSNNWNFDIPYFVYHSEKTLIKKLKVDDTGYLEFRIYYNSQNQVTLHISKFEYARDGETATTEGLGKITTLDLKKHKRRIFNNLIAFTDKLTDDELLKINAETKVSAGYGLILQSKDF